MVKLGMQGRKWDIFESAIYSFAKNGYENVSMREIADENKIQAASLYYHFDSKDALLSLMYQFYQENITDTAPTLEQLYQMISTSTPTGVLRHCLNYFTDELQPLMDNIFSIVVSQASRDPRAFELVRGCTLKNTEGHIRAVLNRMIEQDRIEPMDVETFARLYAGFAFSAAVLNGTPEPMGREDWVKCLDMLFTLVKEK